MHDIDRSNHDNSIKGIYNEGEHLVLPYVQESEVVALRLEYVEASRKCSSPARGICENVRAVERHDCERYIALDFASVSR